MTLSRGSKESESVQQSLHSETADPPRSKSLLPRVELTVTSSGRRWWTSVPGPLLVPKSPWLCGQVCSRFQLLASPPLLVFGVETPE